MIHAPVAGTVRVIDDRKPKQLHIPIARQSINIARENVRLINCWLGIAANEKIGTKFCVGCEYLPACDGMYIIFNDGRQLHPAVLAKDILRKFDIESEYLKDGQK